MGTSLVVAGAMSGTSLDAIDVVIVRVAAQVDGCGVPIPSTIAMERMGSVGAWVPADASPV
jgi:1,6-anhydro-N-acetylmuramate kinase